MDERLVDDLEVFANEAFSRFCRLALIVGPLGSGKTPLIKSLGLRLQLPITNVNLEISTRLLPYTASARPLHMRSIFNELIETRVDPVLLDNIEVLFDTTLKIDPLHLLENLSRSRTIIATWPGRLVDNRLVYAEHWHPEYQAYTQFDAHIFCISTTDNNKIY